MSDQPLLLSGRPARPWIRAVVAGSLLVVLAVAGYLRFDAGAAWTGRALVLLPWLAFAAGLCLAYQRFYLIAADQIGRPNGYAEFIELVNSHRRTEWTIIQRRGERSYIRLKAPWLALALLTILYTGAAFAPLVIVPADGGGDALPRFLGWLVALGILSTTFAVVVARRWYRRAEREWQAQESSPTA